MKIVKIRRYKAGYEIRTETHGGKNPYDIRSAYTPEGHYIGSPKDARYLIVKMGIKPELRTRTSNVCSIGYCTEKWKWYGWSHRAIFGFAVGHTVKEGHVVACNPRINVGFAAKDLTDCKKLAKAFAAEVS